MPISLTCSQCGKQHRVADSHAGKSARCVCGAKIRIPELEVAILDELSSADMTRSQPVLVAAGAQEMALAAAPALVGSPAAEYLERARSKLTDEQEREALFDQTPNAVKLAVGGLGALGAFSLLAAFLLGCMIALNATVLIGGSLAAAIAIVVNLMLSAVGGTAAALVQFRVRGARAIGIVAALMGLIGCSPVHFIATIVALLGLSSQDTVKWLNDA